MPTLASEEKQELNTSADLATKDHVRPKFSFRYVSNGGEVYVTHMNGERFLLLLSLSRLPMLTGAQEGN